MLSVCLSERKVELERVKSQKLKMLSLIVLYCLPLTFLTLFSCGPPFVISSGEASDSRVGIRERGRERGEEEEGEEEGETAQGGGE